MTRIVIVGGGIAGLAAAYYAARKRPEAHITLIESSDRWGGKITTDRVPFDNGQFIIEGGPDTFLAAKPYAAALCRELGLGERLHGTNPKHRNTYVLHRSRLEPLPDGLAMMIPTNVQAILKSNLVSWPGKARMGLDFLQPAKPVNGDESLGAFVSRRLGREAYENLIEPLMSGIYAGDGDLLSLASTFPYLRDLELKYGSLARGALEMRRKSNGQAVQGSRSAFLTPTTGLAEMVEALVKYLQSSHVDLRLNTRVTAIESLTPGTSPLTPAPSPLTPGPSPLTPAPSPLTPGPSHLTPHPWHLTLNNGSLPADALLLAAPAFVSGTLLASLDPALASALTSIPYASTATVTLAYRQNDLARPLDGYGYVIPRRERRRALACTWTSTKFPHRAPEGCALLRVFIGRAGQELPSLTGRGAGCEDDLLELAKEESKLTLGITAEPLLVRVFLWDKAMPQYNLGHPEILKRIDTALEKYPSLALAGNGYRGIGIPDCIHSAELAVNKIVESRRAENSPVHVSTALSSSNL